MGGKDARVMRLPCLCGDTLYVVSVGGEIRRCECAGFVVGHRNPEKDKVRLRWLDKDGEHKAEWKLGALGRHVFTSLDEAVKRLEAVNDDKDMR